MLLTGGAMGIGYETAKQVVGRGGRVAMLDVDESIEEAAGRLGDRATGFVADVTDREGMADAVERAVHHLGGLDVAIANAGIAQPLVTVDGTADELFDGVMAVNVHGVWNTVTPVLERLVASRGQLAIVSSVYSFLNGVLFGPYGMSKAAVESLGRTLRVELAPKGVGVTVAYYGFVDTAFVHGSFDGDEVAARLEATFPGFLTRRITPQRAAEALADGLERRAPRVIAPWPWPALQVMRGLSGPALDRVMTLDPRMKKVLGAARERQNAGDGSVAPTGEPAHR